MLADGEISELQFPERSFTSSREHSHKPTAITPLHLRSHDQLCPPPLEITNTRKVFLHQIICSAFPEANPICLIILFSIIAEKTNIFILLIICRLWYFFIFIVISWLLIAASSLIVLFVSRNFRMICTNLLCTAEKEACFACLDHSKIIVGISTCDSLKSHGLQCFHSSQLDCLHRILNPVISPSSATSRVLQGSSAIQASPSVELQTV